MLMPKLDDRTALIVDSKKDPIALSIFLLEDNPGLIKCENNLYLYNGKCYDLISSSDILAMLHRFLMDYGITSAWTKRNDIVQSVYAYSKLPVVKKMNDYVDLMCVNNGIVNINTKEMMPHSPSFYFDSVINVDYNPEQTECPAFLSYLRHTFNNDEDTIANAIMLGGYLLDSGCEAKKMFIFNGSGGNGKSVLIDTFSMFFSDASTRPQITSISLTDLSGDKFKKYDLITSRVNLSSEEKKGYIDSEEIKKIISGELINVRGIYKETVTFRPKTKLVVAVNNLFKFTDTSDGTARRLIIFNFLNQYKDPAEIALIKFADQKKLYPWDLELPNKIKEERSAILNLFITGLIKLKERKYQFIIGDAYQKAMEDYRRDSDTVREFLEDNYEINMDAETPIIDIYNHYRFWYRANVQDSSLMKFRVNEMARRLKDIFGVESNNRKPFYNKETQEWEKLSTYPIKRIIIEGEPVVDTIEEEPVITQLKANFGGEVIK